MNKNSLILLIVLLLTGAFLIYRNYLDDKMLENFHTTFGILTNKKDGEAVHGTASGEFEYNIKGVKYKFTESGNFLFLNLGDTVLIKYAKKDFKVAKVIDKYYMQKHSHLSNK